MVNSISKVQNYYKRIEPSETLWKHQAKEAFTDMKQAHKNESEKLCSIFLSEWWESHDIAELFPDSAN